MSDYEKLGVFYLGREYDVETRSATDNLLLYDAKDLTTHAVCVGMTGSGKTGLCLALLEEAAIDGIPALIIDPKGDLGNLLLTFPELRPEDFRPWVDAGEATRKGQTLEDLAGDKANAWRRGLAEWGQTPERIARLRDSADIAIYTPGSEAGLPLTVLRSFAAPPAALREQGDALRERILATVSGLLALLGIVADPIRSREHILLATILEQAWRAGRDVDMAGLIRDIQSPPFEKVGFLDLESFFPAQDRFQLALLLNNLLASPGFAAWMTGEPLDIGRLLHTGEGKPRLSILSIAHLSDAERMFFVTILLNEVVTWMRAQPGTSSLRAIVYMDEVFGYFPPVANPPSKQPLLTLMKQARAYGVGVVLATQNPVDLDYKGLSNAGTWLLGRLQTERDKERLLDGLEGANLAAGVQFDRRRMEAVLSSLGNRVFLMNNVHDDEPVVFQTRWALSYLAGPLTRSQITRLMEPRKSSSSLASAPATMPAAMTHSRPILPPGVPEAFVPQRKVLPAGGTLVYHPALLGMARVHYVKASQQVNHTELLVVQTEAADETPPDAVWENADITRAEGLVLDSEPQSPAQYGPLPASLLNPKSYSKFATALKNHLYRTHSLPLWKCRELNVLSAAGETEGEFRSRLSRLAHEQRDLQVEKLRKKYAPKLATLQDRIRRAEQRVEKEKSQASQKTLQAAISFGSSILGAMFGRKLASATNVSRAASSMRAASRVSKERQDISHAEDSVEAFEKQLAELNQEFERESETARTAWDPAHITLETEQISPRKSDVEVQQVTLVWLPWIIDPAGRQELAS